MPQLVFALLLSLFSLPLHALGVVTTTGMIADISRQVGGDHVEVQSLMASGVDPHLYKATQGDLGRLLKADIIFFNGLHLEGKMNDVLRKLAQKKPVYAVSDGLDEKQLITINADEKIHDPHIWFDVRLWIHATEVIRDRLSELDPANAADYKTNAQHYLGELQQLHSWVGKRLAEIPQQQRVLITAHDAFNYFGRAYGMDVVGLQGISTASEFGLNDLKRVRELIIERGVKAVFVESSVPVKFIESLQQGLASQGHHVSIGGQLYSDAMGAEGTEDGTYIGMVRHNVNTMVEALK